MENDKNHPFLQIEDGLKKEFIDKSLEWFKKNYNHYYHVDWLQGESYFNLREFENDFKKHMEQ